MFSLGDSRISHTGLLAIWGVKLPRIFSYHSLETYANIAYMNILLTSAGRRSYMVDYFKEALCGEGLVFASNSQLSPALYAADKYFITPLIYDDSYIPFLLGKCREFEIGLIVSLFDIDLPVLAMHREDFEAAGTKVAVSDADMLYDCNDKYNMFLRLWRAGIRCPETETNLDSALLKIDAMNLSWPMLVKPRFGMGSMGLFKAYDKKELKAAYSMCMRECMNSYLKYESSEKKKECVIIQEMRDGNEYGLDIISDLDGNYLNTIVRRKISMRSGETDEAVVLGDNDNEYQILKELGEKIAAAFKPKGLIDVDVIMNTGNMAPYVIDINARFGGGYPFSHLAGADVPKAYILFAEGHTGEAEKYLEAEPGVHGYKDIAIRRMN